MRKWLIILGLLILGIFAALWWLGQSFQDQRPVDGEVRMEIEHVF